MNSLEDLEEKKVIALPILSLAFVGDGVWTLFVREYLTKKTIYNNTSLHKLQTKFVKASYQAKAIENLKDFLNEKELSIYKRARNSKSNTIPKNQTLLDYKKATGFEAVLGYNFLVGNKKRLSEIFEKFYEELSLSISEEKNDNCR